MTPKPSTLKVIFAAISLIMIVVTIKASLQLNLFQVLPDMFLQPWMQATLIDHYFNILILWSWVLYKENDICRSLLWLVAFTALGSIATAFYVLLQLKKLKFGDPIEKVLVRAT